MPTATLRNWGGAIAVSLPKKILALLDLRAGAPLDVTVKDGKIILVPARLHFALGQLLKEQKSLERKLGRLVDKAWFDEAPRGRETL